MNPYTSIISTSNIEKNFKGPIWMFCTCIVFIIKLVICKNLAKIIFLKVYKDIFRNRCIGNFAKCPVQKFFCILDSIVALLGFCLPT